MIVLRFNPVHEIYNYPMVTRDLHETYTRRVARARRRWAAARGVDTVHVDSIHTVSTCIDGLRQARLGQSDVEDATRCASQSCRLATCQSPMARAERAKKGTESQRARQARQAAFASKPSFHHHFALLFFVQHRICFAQHFPPPAPFTKQGFLICGPWGEGLVAPLLGRHPRHWVWMGQASFFLFFSSPCVLRQPRSPATSPP